MNTRPARNAIRNRLLLSMAVTVLLGVFVAAFVFMVAAGSIRTLAERRLEMNALQTASETLRVSLVTQETYVFDYALSGRDEALEEFDAATGSALLAYVELRTAAAPYPSLSATVEDAHRATLAWREEWAEPFLRSVGNADTLSGAATVAASEVLFLPAEEKLAVLDAALGVRRAENAAEIQASIPKLALIVVPFGAFMALLLAVVGIWLTRTISGPLVRLNRTAEALVDGEAVEFHPERDDEVGALAGVLERLRIDVATRFGETSLDGERAAVFNQLAGLTSFASSEQELVDAAARALWRLVSSTSGDILLANPSKNRLAVGTAWGVDPRPSGTIVPLDRIDRCPGIRRSSTFVAEDLGDDLSVRCPAHPAEAGTVACVPMSALGALVGVIHLERPEPGALGAETMALVARVAETVGLAIANARLMKTMEGQAMTDSLTGLRNARFFDPYLEQELQAAERDQEPLSVIMLDIDHFKEFNDTHGHPAGDEALRTFGRVLGASVRASDVAARYGGEEFIIALRHAGLEEARNVAEKIRLSIEQMVIELGPGRYGRITASLGIASTEQHVRDMKALVGHADGALYRAKESGRNRVEFALSDSAVVPLARPTRRKPGEPDTGDAPAVIGKPA